MPQSMPRPGGVQYTEGPELPADSEVTYSYVPPSLPVRNTLTYTVQFRPFRLEEDGNNYLASTKTVTAPTYGQI